MKKFIRSLLFVVFLSLALAPGARGADKYLSDLDDIYWKSEVVLPSPEEFDMGGEDVSYDRDLGALIPLEGDISPSAQKPMIAVVVDDMGVDRRRSARAALNLNPSVTLSYLPYSPHVQEQVNAAREKGHEIMLHLPMEPDRETANPGPDHLSVDMTKEQLQKHLLASLNGFKGYAGVNNHMGSKFSRYRPGIGIVMEEIEKRGVYFLDSRTAPHSILGRVARERKIPTTYRDVFLDHVGKPEFVTAALREAEGIALTRGAAVIIGHPKDLTLAALEAWIPSAEARGFQIVPLSEVLKYRQAAAAANVAAK